MFLFYFSFSPPTGNIPIYNPKGKKKEFLKKKLVLSGGGIRGISLVGALKAFDELKYLDKLTRRLRNNKF